MHIWLTKHGNHGLLFLLLYSSPAFILWTSHMLQILTLWHQKCYYYNDVHINLYVRIYYQHYWILKIWDNLECSALRHWSNNDSLAAMRFAVRTKTDLKHWMIAKFQTSSNECIPSVVRQPSFMNILLSTWLHVRMMTITDTHHHVNSLQTFFAAHST